MPGSLMTAVLRNRHYDDIFLQSIETVSQNRMKGLDELCESLYEICLNHEHVVILPDFDMDGISSGTLGFAGLSELGFNVSLYIPDSSGSYGFKEKDIDAIIASFPDVKAIITCDVGSGCHSAISYAARLGIRVFVTDHHMIPVVPKDADVVVNPMRSDDDYEHGEICGAHVLWQVLMHYANCYGTVHHREAVERLRVFAGIGTVSDTMPMLYENRQLVRDAVAICRSVYAEGDFSYICSMGTCEIYTRAFQGLFYVVKAYQELGKITCPDDIDETFFGYYMAPMFNSLKRMGISVEEAFLVFFGGEQEERVASLMALNEQRKLVVEQYMDEIRSSSNPHAPYIYVTNVPGGLAGLIAMKLHQESGEPTIVLRKTERGYEGSGRSPSWYPFLSLVGEFGDGRISAAGHEGAFGFFAEDENVLFDLFMYISATANAARPEMKELVYDAIIGDNGDANLDVSEMASYVHDKNVLRPFGPQFETPVIMARFSSEFAVFDYIGNEQQHLRITLPGGIKILCWNQAGMEKECGDVIQVIGDINENTFRQITSYQMEGQIVI